MGDANWTLEEARDHAAFLRRSAQRVRADGNAGWLSTAVELEGIAAKWDQIANDLEAEATADSYRGGSR